MSNLDEILQSDHSFSFAIAAKAISRTFPDLEMLNWRQFAIAKMHVPLSELGFSVVMASLWVLFFFTMALLIFRRKDFE